MKSRSTRRDEGDRQLGSEDSATVHRNLVTGRTIWAARRQPPVPTRRLIRAIQCDAVVVGAGISGALIGESLTDAGLDVVLLDRRGPVEGSTAASTALLQYELDTPLSLMARRIGMRRAERLWRRSRLAVDALRERTEWLGIRAETATRASLYLDGNLLDAGGLEIEADARRRAGFQVELLGPARMAARYGIAGRHALLGFGNYSADPQLLARGFLNAAIRRGARLYRDADVLDLFPAEAGVTLTASGRSGRPVEIRARHAVFATGYEMPKGVPRMGNRVASTWCIATRPQPRNIWPTAAMIWEASDPYLYVRATPRGEVICGGEDEPIADAAERDGRIARKAQILSRKLQALLPSIDPTPACAWAGSFGASPIGSPTIGPVPRMANCFAAMGYGGNGITFSMMAAQMLRSLLTGGRDPDLDLVSFRRRF